MEIVVKPVKATEELMAFLEEKKVVTRICPGHDQLNTVEGEARCEKVYSTDPQFGPHKLITVTINTIEPKNFMYHSDKEDFILIDKLGTTELILTVSLCHKDELLKKIETNTVSTEDFVSVICERNNPYLSFFTMNPYYPHVETCRVPSENPPSFYVGEPKDLDENLIDFKGYQLIIEQF
ncbi:MAG TPA: hypothetical protein VEF53_12925 [Patescibacteria group bacterium]|nr:hypothetical protein [Patescibacteria group bacterium]